MTTDSKLIPCPFCGGAAELHNREGQRMLGGAYIRCTGCEASTPILSTAAAVVASWNQRAHRSEQNGEPMSEEQIDEIAATVRICFGKNAGAFNDGVDAMAAELRRAHGIGSKHD